MSNELLDHAKGDIEGFLENNKRFFVNERDFQMHLALWLKATENYDEVEVEYAVPKIGKIAITDEEYPWETEIKIDIVVSKQEEYLPIELKYKTKKVEHTFSNFRFGEDVGIPTIKNQSAQNLGRYAFWKDVYRIELLRRKFKNVSHGIAVFLTNDESYTNSAKNPKADYNNFNLAEGLHTNEMHWQTGDKEEYKNFKLENQYTIHWKKVEYQKEKCIYCIVVIY